jgi:ribosomal-protein-alanine N-acetyltransferase
MVYMDFELRKWRPEDAESAARYADNKHIADNLRDAFPFPYTLQDAENYIKCWTSDDETKRLCRAVCVDGKAVGSIGVFPGGDVYRKSAELGYWLGEEFWNRGIMTAAVKQICKEAFERFDIVRIYAEPYAHNLGSRKVLEKAGFSLEGVMKNGAYKTARC